MEGLSSLLFSSAEACVATAPCILFRSSTSTALLAAKAHAGFSHSLLPCLYAVLTFFCRVVSVIVCFVFAEAQDPLPEIRHRVARPPGQAGSQGETKENKRAAEVSGNLEIFPCLRLSVCAGGTGKRTASRKCMRVCVWGGGLLPSRAVSISHASVGACRQVLPHQRVLYLLLLLLLLLLVVLCFRARSPGQGSRPPLVRAPVHGQEEGGGINSSYRSSSGSREREKGGREGRSRGRRGNVPRLSIPLVSDPFAVRG